MKKTLIISNLFWVLLFSAFLFKNCTPDASTGCQAIAKSYEKTPFVGFPAQTADIMSRIYQNDRGTKGMSVAEMKDTRSVWFSMDSLKKFIWHVENATCEVNEGEISDLGVRIYFSRYPAKEEIRKLRGFEKLSDQEVTDLAGKHSLFLVPTLRTERGDVDYDAIGNLRKKREAASGKSPKKAAMFFVEPTPPFESIMNHATLCPVACSGTTN